ncbi:E3 ubiquitin-protein ligase APD2-like isoform X2 [Humulus lupulus]|uniref:E3 ubiquitin-protein ligase APD2-like isoform X2 n=1 Tax=Humulus lupulus TaxID=3486 RepID=UPI002B40FB1E|nr:E3 ubiquitin-protein ligase APD2-like isoform X2 [Humulus lupulus]
MEEPEPSTSSATFICSSSSSSSSSQVQEEENDQPQPQDSDESQNHQPQQTRYQRWSSVFSYFCMNNNTFESQLIASDIRDDAWPCFIVLVTFWFLAFTTLILGYYGSSNFQLGPKCSLLIQTNSLFVHSFKVEELKEAKPGLVLYGFYERPPLDVEFTWTETHNTSIPLNFHMEWIYFLNEGSRIDVVFHIKSSGSLPLLLAIAEGRESLVEWAGDPSYPSTTLSWNIIYGSGKIEQEITKSSSYYITLGNLNSEEVEVELEFTIKALLYNTTKSYYRCSLGNHLCSLKLSFLGTNTVVLTSPDHNENSPTGDEWYVKLSYRPRWLTYFIGSGRVDPERTSLIFPIPKEDVQSLGSSYDSLSREEEDLEWLMGESSLEGYEAIDGEENNNNNNNNNPRLLCIICFDSPRDCFFLPCGHCAACFTCATRIAEDAGICPICRRKTKKVRNVYIV